MEHAGFVKRIFTTSSPLIRHKMLQSSNDEIIKTISEVLLNIYNGNLPISKPAINKMKKAKRDVLKIINKKTLSEVRKKLIIKNSERLIGIAEVFK